MDEIDDLARRQALVCRRAGSPPAVPGPDERLGLALGSLERMPLHGVRLPPAAGTSGWYVWGGEHSDAPDFFRPVHHAHLPELLPRVLDYLALAPGFRFIIDDEGYEDVWFDATPDAGGVAGTG